jgi:acyl dehydratase
MTTDLIREDLTTPPPPMTDGPLTVNDSVRYQGASGDLNPIHHDTPFAKAAGYPAPFAVGMRQAGVLAAYAANWLGADNMRRLKVRFLEQAWPGDELTYRLTVSEVRHEGGATLVDLDLTCSLPDGRTHVRGWATFELPDRPTPSRTAVGLPSQGAPHA